MLTLALDLAPADLRGPFDQGMDIDGLEAILPSARAAIREEISSRSSWISSSASSRTLSRIIFRVGDAARGRTAGRPAGRSPPSRGRASAAGAEFVGEDGQELRPSPGSPPRGRPPPASAHRCRCRCRTTRRRGPRHPSRARPGPGTSDRSRPHSGGDIQPRRLSRSADGIIPCVYDALPDLLGGHVIGPGPTRDSS